VTREEQIDQAQKAYDAARAEVRKQLTFAEGARRAETRYSEAYQRLVRLGVAPQLKLKHRTTDYAYRRFA
jgi:hypothetical protein